MKATGLCIIGLASLAIQPPKPAPFTMFSFEDTSCGTWMKSARDESARAQYVSWFRGFVSGYNHGRADNQVEGTRMPDSSTLVLYIDKFCREKPLSPFVGAAIELVKETRQRPDLKP